MCNEYPRLVSRKWFDEAGYDGVFEESMTICVESYIGRKEGKTCQICKKDCGNKKICRSSLGQM
jgi:hypothetical protein